MKLPTSTTTLLVLILVLITGATTVVAQQEQAPIRNFLRINDQFCTGGQPRLEHLEKLKAEGVKTIINLRQPSEHRADEEEAKAKALGLRYFNIPVVYRDPKEEQATEFLNITDDPANRPAFIHCNRGHSRRRVLAYSQSPARWMDFRSGGKRS